MLLTAHEVLQQVAHGLPRTLIRQVWQDAELMLPAQATPFAIEETLLQAALQNQRDDPDYGILARNILLRRIYREALSEAQPSREQYQQGFIDYIQDGVQRGLIDARLLQLNLAQVAQALQPERDHLLQYLGLATLYDRYLVRDLHANRVLELPQYLFMRVALGVSLSEAEPEHWAQTFYHQMSQLRYLPGTPTLFNSGTPHHQLSSCYLADVEDDLEHILESAHTFGLLAKYAGGVGISVSKLRAMGSPVKGVNGRSSGVIPFINMYDALFKAIDQGGRRRGTLAVYIEPWHLEIEPFLDLKRNSGDHYRRAHAIDTVLWIPDEFMRRVELDQDWTLFDPALVPELTELYADDFVAAYQAYEAISSTFPSHSYRVVRARELFHQMLATLQETSHPWITFKDASNLRSPNRHVGVVHSSNLCTEIMLPTDRDHIAVCNLASINLAQHMQHGQLDWDLLAQSVTTAIRQLDNVIDLNFYPSPKAKRSNQRIRPIGLGVMGFTELTQHLRLPYGSSAALQLSSDIMAFMNYYASQTSAQLAQEKGIYPAFVGSSWANGQITSDSIQYLHPQTEAIPESQLALDWAGLRQRVQQGMRNSVTQAIAPTATIGLIAGTTPSLDPHYANIYARNTLSGKFLEMNTLLVQDLKRLGLWEALRDDLIRERGDLSRLDVPQELKDLYQTAFQIEPQAYLEVAARAQRYVDMGISRNLYLRTRDVHEMRDVYLTAWKMGLKSTYYLFVEQRMTTEQSTVRVNKSKTRPKWAALVHSEANPAIETQAEPTEDVLVCSLDSGCESCQ